MLSFIIIGLVCQALPSPSTTAHLIMIMVANFVWCILGIWAPTCSEYANAADLLLGGCSEPGSVGRRGGGTCPAPRTKKPHAAARATKSHRHRSCPRHGTAVPALGEPSGFVSPWARWSICEQRKRVAWRARIPRCAHIPWHAHARPYAINTLRTTPAMQPPRVCLLQPGFPALPLDASASRSLAEPSLPTITYCFVKRTSGVSLACR